MADKFLNINIVSAGVSVITPMKISNISGITSAVAVNVPTFTITYGDGGTVALVGPTAGAAASGNFSPISVVQRAAVIRSLWQQVIKGIATPWNLPVLPGANRAWDQTVSPQPQVPVVPQGQGPANPALSAKVATQLLGGETAGAVTGTFSFVSVG